MPVSLSAQDSSLLAGGGLFGLRGRQVELPAYTGPLDLLLKLIRKNEIDIYDIPIALLTEQYLAEMEAMEHQDLQVAGDFLLMASTLLEIKSALMLPRPAPPADEEEADPRAELVQRLLEYQAFQTLAEELARLEQQRRLLFGRPFLSSVVEEYQPSVPPAPNLKLENLCRSFQTMLARLEARGEPVTSIPREEVPLRLRIAEVVADLRLAGGRGMLLEQLARPERGRLFVIVSFLAILELLKMGKIRVEDAGESHRFWLVRSRGD